jgi:hypothetical protein
LNCSAPSGAMRTNSAPTWSMAVIHTLRKKLGSHANMIQTWRRRLPAVPLHRATRPLLNDVDSRSRPAGVRGRQSVNSSENPSPLLGQDPPIHGTGSWRACLRIVRGSVMPSSVVSPAGEPAMLKPRGIIRVERCAAPGTRRTDLARNLSIRFSATMDASAPGRTRTCNGRVSPLVYSKPIFRRAGTLGGVADPGRMPSCMTRLSVSGPPPCSACLPS